MLPYRLRAPYYDGYAELEKLHQRQEQQQRGTATGGSGGGVANEARPRRRGAAGKGGRVDYVDGGGPLQRAVYEDLRSLRDALYLPEIEKRRKNNNKRGDGVFAVGGAGGGIGKKDGDGAPSAVAAAMLRHGRRGDGSRGPGTGTVFADIFGERVFKANRVALLHTRFVPLNPIRMDLGAYTQLLYAACFELLREAFLAPTAAAAAEDTSSEEDEASANDEGLIDKASFAVFCLYALYQTNPSEESTSSTAALPMGKTKRFRRSYRKQPIRIDAEHYGYLCQLRDLAVSQRDICQAEHYQCLERPDARMQSTSLCRCAVATDVIQVLNRLENCFEYCSYTGPCGLEAMAGHADCAIAALCTAPDIAAQMSGHDATDDGSRVDDGEEDEDSTPPSFALSSPHDMEAKLKNYLDSCAAIRLPPPPPRQSAAATITGGSRDRSATPAYHHRRWKRVRDELAPIFASSSTEEKKCTGDDDGRGGSTADDVAYFIRCAVDPAARIDEERRKGPSSQKRVKVLQNRTVTFGREVVVMGTNIVLDDKNGQRNAETEAVNSQSGQLSQGSQSAFAESSKEVVHELVLPSGLSSTQEQSIEAAVECLLARDHSILMPAALAETDEVSALYAGGVSVGGVSGASSAGVARFAFRELLRRATNGGARPITTAQRPMAKKATRQPAHAGFLEEEEPAVDEALAGSRERPKHGEPDLSDLSSDEGDVISVAAESAVGRRALSELLAGSAASGRIRGVPRTKGAHDAQGTSSSVESQQSSSKSSDEDDDDDEEEEEGNDLSDNSSTVQGGALAGAAGPDSGRNALNELLAISQNKK